MSGSTEPVQDRINVALGGRGNRGHFMSCGVGCNGSRSQIVSLRNFV